MDGWNEPFKEDVRPHWGGEGGCFKSDMMTCPSSTQVRGGGQYTEKLADVTHERSPTDRKALNYLLTEVHKMVIKT